MINLFSSNRGKVFVVPYCLTTYDDVSFFFKKKFFRLGFESVACQELTAKEDVFAVVDDLLMQYGFFHSFGVLGNLHKNFKDIGDDLRFVLCQVEDEVGVDLVKVNTRDLRFHKFSDVALRFLKEFGRSSERVF